jgi:hypothetical protein
MVNYPNCGNRLPEPVPPYCPNCGNSTNPINPTPQPSKKKGNAIWYGIIVLGIVFFVGLGLSVASARARNDLVGISEQMWSNSSLDSKITTNSQCSQCVDLQIFVTLKNPSNYDVEVDEEIFIYAGSKPLSQIKGSTFLQAGKSGIIKLNATFGRQALEEMSQFAIHAESSYTVTTKFLGVIPVSHTGTSAVNIFPTDALTPEAFTIENAIVVPTDISKIDYPSAFNNPTITSVQVIDPYCAIEREEIAYPVEYLGDYEFPQVNGAPLPAEIKRIVGIHDAKIPGPELMDCTNYVTDDAITIARKGFLNTMKRAQSLGADEITITNYLLFSDFKNAELDPPEELVQNLLVLLG